MRNFVDCDIFCTDDFIFDGEVRITGNFYSKKAVKLPFLYTQESIFVSSYFDPVEIGEIYAEKDIFIETPSLKIDGLSSFGRTFIDTSVLDTPCDFFNKCSGNCDTCDIGYSECPCMDCEESFPDLEEDIEDTEEDLEDDSCSSCPCPCPTSVDACLIRELCSCALSNCKSCYEEECDNCTCACVTGCDCGSNCKYTPKKED